MTDKSSDENLLLCSPTAQRLYLEHAAKVPVVDFDCRLSAEDIARDRTWSNLSELWLDDPSKWRLMRAAGVDERYCTDLEIAPEERFKEWAGALQSAVGNPACELVALELERLFGIGQRLSPQTAPSIFARCNALLATKEYSARGLLRRQNIETLCTENDPVESLEYHIQIAQEHFGTKVLPSWLPDAAMAVDDPSVYKAYVDKLGAVSGVEINSYDDLIEALQVRHNFFAANGCRISLHRSDRLYAEECSRREAERIFRKVRKGKRALSAEDICRFKSAMTIELSLMDWRTGWAQVFYYGSRTDVNSRRFAQLGGNAGFDVVGDCAEVGSLVRLLDRLDGDDHLCRTVLCNLNQADTRAAALLAGSFQDSRYGAAKVQVGAWNRVFGSMTQTASRLRTIASTGVLGHCVGIASEAVTFTDFSRHDHFRRTLCNLLGGDIESGALPVSETEQIGTAVENICAANARNFFGI